MIKHTDVVEPQSPELLRPLEFGEDTTEDIPLEIPDSDDCASHKSGSNDIIELSSDSD